KRGQRIGRRNSGIMCPSRLDARLKLHDVDRRSVGRRPRVHRLAPATRFLRVETLRRAIFDAQGEPRRIDAERFGESVVVSAAALSVVALEARYEALGATDHVRKAVRTKSLAVPGPAEPIGKS